MKIIIILLCVTIMNCCISQNTKQQIWKSQFYNLNVKYDSLWSLIPSLDTKEKTLFGLIDKKDGKSYIIKIVNDVPKSQLSDSTYFQATKDMMLKENQKNMLLEEKDTLIHGKKFHSMEFILYTSKWGLLKQYGLISRDGNKIISIQISFPVNEDQKTTTYFPESLIELDKGITIEEK
ncbi:MAG: hypothetical protein HYR91_11910 [Flavobacteriia bacterium]|nr:hypothetical protein [Flavobacteriia bacterium]